MQTFYLSEFFTFVEGVPASRPSSPGLLANLVLRLVLCPLALAVSWVPMTLLWKNGELPAGVLVASNWLFIVLVFANAVLWHDQAFDRWWHGAGWCDLQVYLQFPLTTLYSASVCAIMRRLSQQVGLTRVAGPSGREKRLQRLAQLLVMLPVPLLQVALTVFVQGQRYAIMPVNGCGQMYFGSVLYLVFFVLPAPLFMAAACFHTYQTYYRFREIDAANRAALGGSGSNSATRARSQRARRKLYWMTLSILVPYAPVQAAFVAYNVMMGWPWTAPVDFATVHFRRGGGVPWNSATLKPYDDVGFVDMNLGWIPVLTAFVVFAFFGTSKEGLNVYRRALLRLGLGRIFPRLRASYDPDRKRPRRRRSRRRGHPISSAMTTTQASSSPSKGSFVRMSRHASLAQDTTSSFLDVELADPVVARPTSSVWQPSLHPFHKSRCFDTPSTAADELELGRHAAPFSGPGPSAMTLTPAPVPAAPILFRPGLNWYTPPTLPSLSMPSFFRSLSPSVSRREAVPATLQRPQVACMEAPQDLICDNSLYPFPSPTVPQPDGQVDDALLPGASTTTIGLAHTTARRMVSSISDGTMFDGAGCNGSAVQTLVWSESGRETDLRTFVDRPAAAEVAVQGQSGVRVNHSIMTEVV